MRNVLLALTVAALIGTAADAAQAGHRRRACANCGPGGYSFSGYSYGGYSVGAYGGYAYAAPVHTTGYGGYPTSTLYASRAAYGYGYYRPYGTYYGPRNYTYYYGAFPGVYSPGYLPPRYYGGYGYWGGVGSGYYYGAGSRVSVGVNF